MPDFAEALRRYRKSADAGNSAAMHRLGLAYENGEGLPRDQVEGRCHGASGLRSHWRLGSQGDEENQLHRVPVSA